MPSQRLLLDFTRINFLGHQKTALKMVLTDSCHRFLKLANACCGIQIFSYQSATKENIVVPEGSGVSLNFTLTPLEPGSKGSNMLPGNKAHVTLEKKNLDNEVVANQEGEGNMEAIVER